MMNWSNVDTSSPHVHIAHNFLCKGFWECAKFPFSWLVKETVERHSAALATLHDSSNDATPYLEELQSKNRVSTTK